MADPRSRLLQIRAYLIENTDELHPVTVQELIAYLECSGMTADRRAVYADIALLRASGMKIGQRRGRTGGYYLEMRAFETSELQFLIDSVQSSRMLTQKRCDGLTAKLRNLACRHAPIRLQNMHIKNRLKAIDDGAFQNAWIIHEALNANRKLSFLYCQYSGGKALRPRRGGLAYVVSPCLLLYSDATYYLIADHPYHDGLAHYRVDKMQDVRVLNEPAPPLDPSFDPSQYARTIFSMFPGEQRWVRLAFDKTLLGAMIDRFGADAPMSEIDAQTSAISAPVRITPPFFGWVFQFCGKVRILSPDDVREQMALMIEMARASVHR
jgi:predicted DNA-binding transcriptional regulator YafY